MTEKRIEGVAVFMSDGSFVFDSGLPTAEPVLEEGVAKHRGVLSIEQNASATFVPEPPRAITPPSLEDVLKDKNLIVKRTSRNFIVTMKFPVIESAETTTKSHKDMWKKTLSAIASARETIKGTF